MRVQRRIWLAAILFGVLIASYTSAFFLMRKPIGVTYVNGGYLRYCTLYYFSKHRVVNATAHVMFAPMQLFADGAEKDLAQDGLRAEGHTYYIRDVQALIDKQAPGFH